MSASRFTQTRVTLTVDGDEADYNVCAFVDVGPSGASVDGWAQVYVKGEAYDFDLLDISTEDMERVTEALCDQAIQDDIEDFDDTDPDELWERDCA